MDEDAIAARRKELYDQLGDIVHELVALDGDDQETDFFPTCWGLLVGCECVDEDNDLMGGIAWYPKDGAQPLWKTLGLMHTAISKLLDH